MGGSLNSVATPGLWALFASSVIGLLALDLPLYAKIINVYRKAGIIKSNMTVSELCDASYVDAALKS